MEVTNIWDDELEESDESANEDEHKEEEHLEVIPEGEEEKGWRVFVANPSRRVSRGSYHALRIGMTSAELEQFRKAVRGALSCPPTRESFFAHSSTLFQAPLALPLVG